MGVVWRVIRDPRNQLKLYCVLITEELEEFPVGAQPIGNGVTRQQRLMSCDPRFGGPNSQRVPGDPRTAPETKVVSTANRTAARFSARKLFCDFRSCKIDERVSNGCSASVQFRLRHEIMGLENINYLM